ncbi:hypothetical protein GH714_016760 [Hevea brasiliensis]|uniref:Uncharacterized protein n=1 Tax=Hevea brasiliensis TaxID=3981 RepID=A0A6A6LAX6_HEVBR|nr:hypothetical protein GH714_016760 [Hevea brasiliensis]
MVVTATMVEPEKVLNWHRITVDQYPVIQILIQWKGKPVEEATWMNWLISRTSFLPSTLRTSSKNSVVDIKKTIQILSTEIEGIFQKSPPEYENRSLFGEAAKMLDELKQLHAALDASEVKLRNELNNWRAFKQVAVKKATNGNFAESHIRTEGKSFGSDGWDEEYREQVHGMFAESHICTDG